MKSYDYIIFNYYKFDKWSNTFHLKELFCHYSTSTRINVLGHLLG